MTTHLFSITELLDYIRTNGACSMNTLIDATETDTPDPVLIGKSYHKKLGRLVKQGYLIKEYEKPCGRGNVAYWRAVE